MRRTMVILVVVLLTLGIVPAAALAMQPPADAAGDLFGCVDGDDAAVSGHPGAAVLVDATPLVGGLTGDSLPTV